MRAKLVSENNFQRGLEPKTALNIGMSAQILDFIEHKLPHDLINDYNGNYIYHRIRPEHMKKIKLAFPDVPLKILKKILKDLDFGIPITKENLIGRIYMNDKSWLGKGPWIIRSYKGKKYYQGMIMHLYNVQNLKTGKMVSEFIVNFEDQNDKDFRLPSEEEKIKYDL